MHGNNPTRDSIEQALAFAADEDLIRSWKRTRQPDSAKWEVEVHPNVHSADGLGTYPIRTYDEARLFCAALASARSGMLPKIDAWARLVGQYRDALGIEPGGDPTEYGVDGDMELDGYADRLRSAAEEEKFATPGERVLDGMQTAHRDGQGEWLSLTLVAEYAGMQAAQAAEVLAGLASAGLVEKQGRGTTAAAWRASS